MKPADLPRSLIFKVAIVVAVPLLFQLVLLTIMYCQLDATEKQRRAAEHQRNIRAQGDYVIEMFYDAAASLMPFATNSKSKEGQHFPEVVGRLPIELDRLLNMGDNEYERKSLQKIREPLMRGLRLLQELQKSIGDSDSDFTALIRLKERRHEIATFVTDIKTDISNLLAPYGGSGLGMPTEDTKALENTKLSIAYGAGLGIFVSLAAAFFFNREIVSRLKTISDNSVKISLNEPLNPPVGGRDEIAGLDRQVRQMAVRLEEARKKESAILENAIEVICSIDRSNRITSINSASFDVWGYDPDELLGKNVLELLPAASRQELVNKFSDYKSNPVVSFETGICTTSGAVKEMRFSANYSTEESSWFCVVHDISAAKEVERLKQQFVAMVSHDLRTPLNSLLNLLTLLSEDVYGKLNDTGHQRVSAVEAEIQRLIKLINELLDLEKLEAGSDVLDQKPVPAAEVIDASIAAIQGFADQHKVQLVNDSRSKSILQADKGRLVQVLVNLLSNAIKFSQAGSLVLLGSEDVKDGKGKAFVRLSIKDSGCGIAEDKLATIFERFTQVDGPQKKQGTGLGLAIARAIVQQHNGRIGVESKVGQGSTFWLELPKAGS